MLYNILFFSAIIIGLPVMVPLALMSEKRRKTFRQRLGLTRLTVRAESGAGKKTPQQGPLWIHALSVGEMLSAVPLIHELSALYGRDHICVSASTLTGFETAIREIQHLAACVFFFPYDIPFSVRLRLRQIKPSAVIIVETDIWPNFLKTVKSKNIPAILLNARLSETSFKRYLKITGLITPTLKAFRRIGVQSPADTERFTRLGYPPGLITHTGNIKFQQMIPADPLKEAMDLRGRFGIPAGRSVILAGSTHAAEEPVLCSGLMQIKTAKPEVQFILAPRDPHRAARSARPFLAAGMSVQMLSRIDGQATEHASDVLVVDKMGVLRKLYAVCDIAFIGGSLCNEGGHNPLEAAAYAKPILFGTDMRDFQAVADALREAGGAETVASARQFAAAAIRLLDAPETAADMGQAALRTLLDGAGALEKSVLLVNSLLSNT